jgi:hypothetical protein
MLCVPQALQPGPFFGDPLMTRCHCVLVFSLLLIASSWPCEADEVKEKDYKDVPLDQIGVKLVKPTKDARTGFIVGGKNSTDLVRKLAEINGRQIADLEKDMRPGALGEPSKNGDRFEGSTKGFLGKEEKLLDVLAMDNEFVVDKLGLTHQDIARPLLIVAAIGDKNRFNEKETKFRYHGHDYALKMICYKGYQYSPFYDKIGTSCDAELENLTAKKKLKYSLLVPQMIERYGFYEGTGTPYRVEPSEVLEVFPFLKEKAKKAG